jgi:hypothetical protein
VQIKEIQTFPRHIDTDNKIFISPNAFKKSNLVGDLIIFSASYFLPDLLESFAQSTRVRNTADALWDMAGKSLCF